jgi:hypothetical protein
MKSASKVLASIWARARRASLSKSAGVAGPPLTGSVELPLRHWRQTLLSVIGGQLGIAGQLGGRATSRRERVRLVSMTSTQSHTDHSDHTQAPMVQHPCIPHAESPTNVPLSPRHTFASLHAPATSSIRVRSCAASASASAPVSARRRRRRRRRRRLCGGRFRRRRRGAASALL